ncbi:MAG: hypothetical protein P8M21_02035 [Halioglobus sp.]|nr:hypothetical protein [Halioglobus sp.]
MAYPDKHVLLNWARQYPDLWNAGDKQAWIANWQSVATGEFRMLDPVGTPEKRGFKSCCEDSWDLFQPRVRFRIQPGTLFVCANEVAWCLENHFEGQDGPQVQYSLETYQFGKNSSVNIRTYYRVPAHDNENLGDIFQDYLPANAQGI